jgi:ketosteroid isomerase-like protein
MRLVCPAMAEERGGGAASQPQSVRLARLYFELAGEGNDPRLLEILHDDVEIVLKKLGGPRILRGRDEVAAFLAEMPTAFPLYQSSAETFEAVDENSVIVEGRMRWMDHTRVLRDDPMIWALEFRDDLLLRSTPARSVGEAQAILTTGTPLTSSPPAE